MGKWFRVTGSECARILLVKGCLLYAWVRVAFSSLELHIIVHEHKHYPSKSVDPKRVHFVRERSHAILNAAGVDKENYPWRRNIALHAITLTSTSYSRVPFERHNPTTLLLVKCCKRIPISQRLTSDTSKGNLESPKQTAELSCCKNVFLGNRVPYRTQLEFETSSSWKATPTSAMTKSGSNCSQSCWPSSISMMLSTHESTWKVLGGLIKESKQKEEPCTFCTICSEAFTIRKSRKSLAFIQQASTRFSRVKEIWDAYLVGFIAFAVW